MSVRRLLQIIDQHADDNGYADGNAVKSAYGEATFGDTFRQALLAGYINNSGPVGTISLSPTGEYEARR